MSAASRATRRPALEALTGFRFVAAMAVALYHAMDVLAPSATGFAARLTSHGFLGVSLFFVLSGFILTYTYIDPDTGSLRGSRRSFWWARCARIYPVYAIALLMALPVFVLYRIVLATSPARPAALLSAALTPLLLQSWWPSAACQWNCPGWSLSVEFLFYALFPLLGVWLARRRSRVLVLGVLAWTSCLVIPIAFLAIAPAASNHPTRFDTNFWLQAVKFNPVVHLGEFAVGIVAGLAFMRRELVGMLSSRTFGLMGLGGLVLSAAWLGTTDGPYLLLHDGLLAPLWAVAIITLATGRGFVARVLGCPPMVHLGEASYAVYLVHAPLLGYLALIRGFLRIRHAGVVVPASLAILAYLGGTIVLSLFLFHLVEEPARRWIRQRVRVDARPEAVPPLIAV